MRTSALGLGRPLRTWRSKRNEDFVRGLGAVAAACGGQAGALDVFRFPVSVPARGWLSRLSVCGPPPLKRDAVLGYAKELELDMVEAINDRLEALPVKARTN